MIAVAIVYSLTLLILTILFLVIWLVNRGVLTPYRIFGLKLSGIYVGLELLVIATFFGEQAAGVEEMLIATESVVVIGIAIIISFLRILAYVIVGMHYCTLMRMSGFPYLFAKKAAIIDTDMEGRVWGRNIEDTPDQNDSPNRHPSNSLLKLDPAPIVSHEATSPPRPVEMLTVSSLAALGCIFYSAIVFWLTEPGLSSQLNGGLFDLEQQIATRVTLGGILVVLTVAVGEEIVFRLGIQNFIARYALWEDQDYWRAILLTALLWTLGHIGSLDPDWVKMVQIFPIGILFGWLFKRYGTESCIIAHSLFNLGGLILLTPMLLPA